MNFNMEGAGQIPQDMLQRFTQMRAQARAEIYSKCDGWAGNYDKPNLCTLLAEFTALLNKKKR